MWVGIAVAIALFAAVVVPAVTNVLRPDQIASHVRWDGSLAVIDAALCGQLPLRDYSAFRGGVPPYPTDIVASALLAPFAHPRVAVLLLGDSLFDALGGALIAIALAACLRTLLVSQTARLLLLLLLAALSPAFVSPVAVVDIVHAVVLPVAAAILAAGGYFVLQQQVPLLQARGVAGIIAIAIAINGSILFDVINPRILSASSLGIMYRVLRPDEADRVLVLTYPQKFGLITRWLSVGPITAYAGQRPVGYLEYNGREIPADDFAAEHKDLLFWSYGYDLDVAMPEKICRQWPAADLYEIWDEARLGRAYAARVGGASWQPNAPAGTWRRWNCAASG